MILGLNKTIIDELSTGASTEFHRVDNFSVDTKTSAAYIYNSIIALEDYVFYGATKVE